MQSKNILDNFIPSCSALGQIQTCPSQDSEENYHPHGGVTKKVTSHLVVKKILLKGKAKQRMSGNSRPLLQSGKWRGVEWGGAKGVHATVPSAKPLQQSAKKMIAQRGNSSRRKDVEQGAHHLTLNKKELSKAWLPLPRDEI